MKFLHIYAYNASMKRVYRGKKDVEEKNKKLHNNI